MFPTLRDLCISFLLCNEEISRKGISSDLSEELEEINNYETINRLFKNGRPGLYKLIESPERGLKISLLKGYHQQTWYFLAEGAGNLCQAIGYAAQANNWEVINFLRKKITENADICFTTDGVIRKRWKNIVRDCLERGLRGAARGGHLPLIEFFRSKGEINGNMGLLGAARGGHLEIMESFIYRDFKLHVALYEATCGGHLSLVKYLIKKGAIYQSNLAMETAARAGHRDLVDFFIEEGDDSWEEGLQGASRNGNWELVKYFISKGAKEWNEALTEAAYGGHRNLVDFFIEKGANDWNGGLRDATSGGHTLLVKFFIEKGANDWGTAIMCAAYKGHLNLVKLFVSKGANKHYKKVALEEAANRGNKKIARYLMELITNITL